MTRVALPDRVGKGGHGPPDGVTLDASSLRDVFAHLPGGVSVVTTLDDNGPCGMTVSAVCSVSVDPPLVLVCVSNESNTLRCLLRHGKFAVNVLRDRHAGLAGEFARPAGDKAGRFRRIPYGLVDDVPVLHDALAWLTCCVQAAYPGGDHTIVVGRVCATEHAAGEPLVWHDRRYWTLSPSHEHNRSQSGQGIAKGGDDSATQQVVDAHRSVDGHVHAAARRDGHQRRPA